MRLKDDYGNALTTESAAARDHYTRGMHLFLAAEYGAPDAFDQAVQHDPGFALGHVAKARALMMDGRMPEAKQAMARAHEVQDGVDDREAAHIDVFARLFAGQPAAARNATRAHVQHYPRDAMVAQLCTSVFGLIGFSGDSGREAELLAYTEALLPHYGEDWWMMSQHAISLCETGQHAASEALMARSLALNPRNAHAAHFKSHAQYETGQIADGRRYLADWIEGYDSRALMHGHLSWHLALWALHDGDEAAVWHWVDSGVAPGRSQGLPLNVLTDTVAILYRAEIAGLKVAPERWQEVSAYAGQYFPETGQSFADLHAALGHAMAGDGARLAHVIDTARGFAGDLVRPIGRAWGAIARGDWAEAVADLAPALAVSERVGGSRAQRDLIELAYVHALMRLGLDGEARRTLALRRPVLAGSPPVAGLA